jgi:hypothetical protein
VEWPASPLLLRLAAEQPQVAHLEASESTRSLTGESHSDATSADAPVLPNDPAFTRWFECLTPGLPRYGRSPASARAWMRCGTSKRPPSGVRGAAEHEHNYSERLSSPLRQRISTSRTYRNRATSHGRGPAKNATRPAGFAGNDSRCPRLDPRNRRRSFPRKTIPCINITAAQSPADMISASGSAPGNSRLRGLRRGSFPRKTSEM